MANTPGIPERPVTARLHTVTSTATGRASPVIAGSDGMTGIRMRPVRYRYVMANIRSGRIIGIIPMTGVTYSVGIFSGQDLSGTVYLPDMFLDQMVHAPLYKYARWQHFDKGTPLGSLFEVGNVAIYVMRNEEVVWGGILWSRAYSSGEKTMAITALSWDAYVYYRALRKTVAFPSTSPKTDKYVIWRALLAQVLHPSGSDFYWPGDPGYNNSGVRLAEAGDDVPWTGLYGARPPTQYLEYWPFNSPPIELPPPNLTMGALTTIDESWQGFQMDNVGAQLEQFAKTSPLTEADRGFEYRVVCWWDGSQERFRQRYSFGQMNYDNIRDPNDVTQTPLSIRSPEFGQSYANAEKTIFDYPGHVSQWSLSESMENAATRIIVTGGSEDTKIAAYKSDVPTLRPGLTGNGSNGWLLYDKVINYETSLYSELESRAHVAMSYYHVPIAAQISDMSTANSPYQRSSVRSTELSVSLYVDPTTVFPPWGIGDWVVFAINDALYGGVMYLKRRILQYSVTVMPDHESDFSHEQISLELTDKTKTEVGG